MSGKIDETLVRHIARLARLSLTDEEVSRFGAQLGSIIEYVEQLGSIDTSGIEPTAHPLPIRNVLRADEPGDSLPVDLVLANAPDKAPPYFKVPKVLDQETA